MLKQIHEKISPFIKKEILGPLFVALGAFLLYQFITKITKRIFGVKNEKIDERKRKTILSVINNIFKYLILTISVLIILEIYGISTSGILTSLGVVGVVGGLAVQDTLKDILSGMSIIVENQYGVGDIISIGDFKGEVIFIGLRTTRIKANTGEVKIIANRNITEVVNHSISASLAIVNIPVSYDESIERVQNVLDELCKKIKKENKLITGKIVCLGITSLDESSINFRITAEVKSMKQYEVERMILKEVKTLFDIEKINIPYNQVVVHHA
jgi:small conductance mechanosensitive channel